MLWLVPFIGIFLIGVTPSIAASEPIEMLVSKDWGAYRYNDNGVRVCFISSAPKKSAGKYDPANRGETRVFVSHGPGKAERNVVQVIAGYNYKKQSDVTVKIDNRKSPSWGCAVAGMRLIRSYGTMIWSRTTRQFVADL